MERWRSIFDAETLRRIDALTEEQKQAAAEAYATSTLQNLSGHLTVDQAREALDSWPIYYSSWLKKANNESL